MEFLSDRLWPQIQRDLKTATEVLATTWVIKLDALLKLAEAAPKARIRIIINMVDTPSPPFTSEEEYRKVKDQLGDRVEIRANTRFAVLHAKVMIIRGPSDLAIVGSGNLTRPGLGCKESGNNIEASVLFKQGPEFNRAHNWFKRLFKKMQAYEQDLDGLNGDSELFTKISQRPFDKKERGGQKKEKDNSDEETLSTTQGDIQGLMLRLKMAMRERTSPPKLWDHQKAILKKLQQKRGTGIFHELVVLPVGAGKTQIAAEFIASCFSKSNKPLRILWIAHTLQLVEQAAVVVLSQLRSSRITIPTILLWLGKARTEKRAKDLEKPDPCMAFATVQSLDSLRDALRRQTFDLVVVDEAHHIGAPDWGKVINSACSGKTGNLLGLTATPDRLDGVDLGFNKPYYNGDVTFRTLVEGGEILAVPRYQAVRTRDGQIADLRPARNEAQARKNFENGIRAFDKDWRNSFIAKDLAQRNSGKTLVFCATKNHADNLQRELIQASLPEDQVRSVHSDLAISKRAEALEWFRASGHETRFLLNCKLYIEGFDMTDVRTIVLARPTLSPTYWVQMIGRGVRRSKDHPSFDIIEYTDKYKQGGYDTLRASFYLLHDNGLTWWRELRNKWPNIKTQQINSWNKKTQNIYSKMLVKSETGRKIKRDRNLS